MSSPLGIRNDERVAVFIDGPNLYSASKTSGVEIDYKKLTEHLEDESMFVRATYYTTLIASDEPDGYSPIKPLLDWLGYNGYQMVTKTVKEFHDNETGLRRQKGSMNVEIAVDMLSLVNDSREPITHVVLFSGDSDYRRLIEAVQAKGVRVTVVSSMKTGTPMISDEVRRQADRFVDLSDLKGVIGRPPREESDRRTLR
jgi:uncharacterized LabA/DUF88 family protein